MKSYVGVDGCKAGWFGIEIQENGAWSHRVFESGETILEHFTGPDPVLIDIPIGLIDEDPEERQCDKEARRLLGAPRSSSVFPAPCRGALHADSFEEASRINRIATSRGLSLQSWAIAPKIREIDELMSSSSDARKRLIEVHPELLFWALNGQSAMQRRKKTQAGETERLRVLERSFPLARGCVEEALSAYPRRAVARDDVIDAMVSAIAAYISGSNLEEIPSV